MVLGLTSVPRAGDTFLVAPDDRTARQIAEKREAVERAALLAKRRKRISLEDFTKALEQGKVQTLNLILKGDGSGSVEALEDALLQIDVGEEVELRVIDRGVGAITRTTSTSPSRRQRDHRRLQRPAGGAGRRPRRPRGRRHPATTR